MLKKLFKIGLLAGGMLFACTAYAQENESACAYPQYGPWSNWSLSGKLMYNWEPNSGNPFEIGKGSNVGLGLILDKEINHKWAVRFILQQSGLIPVKDWTTTENNMSFDQWWKLGVDAKYSFQNKCFQLRKENYWYAFAGVGLAMDFHNDNRQAIVGGYVGEYINAGLGYNWKVADHSSIFVEAGADVVADAPAFWRSLHHVFLNLGLGYTYHFGITEADAALQQQRSLLTQENFDRLNEEIDGLRKDLRQAKERETKLINRINELEDQIAHMSPTGNEELVDSLRKVIEEYETNKHNFYAMPFSITYAVDQYTVPASQMGKVNAIAQILKDNEDINLEIVGYCDYSGSDEYNQKLSERRAEYVKKLLVRKGIDESRLTTSGKGKTTPFGDIKNPINRRTSFYRVNK